MKNLNIQEFNNLCAELLGFVNTTPTDKDFNIYENKKGVVMGDKTYTMLETMSMKFHSDWNWIMAVVDAVEELGSCTICNIISKGDFKINRYGVKFYFAPNNQNLLHLELKPFMTDDTFKHPMFKYHIIEEFDFKKRSKKEAVVQALYQFLIWYSSNCKK